MFFYRSLTGMKTACLVVITLLLFTPVSHAKLLLDVGAGYFSDSVTTSSSDTSKKLVYNFSALLSISKNFWGGWGYMNMSSDRSQGATDVQLAGYSMGPAFKYQFGRSRTHSISAVYNLINNATYTTNTSTEEWSGSGYSFQFAAMPEVRENLFVGFTINYHSVNYSKKVVGSTESSVSYTRTWLYPTLSLTKEF